MDLWVKDARVELPDGTSQKVVPTAAQLRSIKNLPEHFRTAKFGRGKRWRVSWYEDTAGRRIQRGQVFEAKKDAEELVAELEDDIRMGRYIDPNQKTRTVRDAAEIWLASKHRIKDSTWRRYRRELDNYVLPKWGSTPVGAITREAIDTWVVELQEATAPYDFDAGPNTPHSRRKPRKMAPRATSTILSAAPLAGSSDTSLPRGGLAATPSEESNYPASPKTTARNFRT